MIDWIKAEGGGHYFFIAFPICLVLLLLLMKGRRLRFLVPNLIITSVIMNPLFYKKWEDLGLYAYWRILWIIPVIPVVASVIPAITERFSVSDGLTEETQNIRLVRLWKVLVVALGIVGIVFGGSFIYNTDRGQFQPISNTAKIPEYVQQIGDKLLELKNRPRVIVQHPIGVYLRQYSGDIDTAFGRDIDGYIWSRTKEKDIHKAITSADWETVNQTMLDDSYDYLVASGVNNSSLELVDTVGGYGIYRATGHPTVIKERNALGQVIRTTFVDEKGNPVNGEEGYATVAHIYDNNGFIISEFRTDIEGNGVANSNGFAGYERKYDKLGHVTDEITLNPEGKAAPNRLGYAEIKREYSGNNLLRESYCDVSGDLVNRPDVLYASIVFERDKSGNAIREWYYDADDKAVISVNGYAEIRKTYIQNQLVDESYYGIDGNAILNTKGYASLHMEYDDKGNVIEKSYYDCSGSLTNQIDGYAQDIREYDAGKHVIFQRFLNKDRNPVVVYTGYAEVHRKYDDGGMLIKEEYYGTDREPLVQPAGHVAIEQEWNAEGKLIRRRYLDASGNPILRIDGYQEAVWSTGEYRTDVHLLNESGVDLTFEHMNLAKDIIIGSDGWSQWMIPAPNRQNSTFNIGFANLGEKHEGDLYTCQIEIEFRGVAVTEGQSFLFRTQGAQDNRWGMGNVWDNALINLYDVPADGVYQMTSTRKIKGEMVNVSSFNLGFRCDYWSSGMFRIRNVKIEKGDTVTEWSPGI